jgi:hypothetical protein
MLLSQHIAALLHGGLTPIGIGGMRWPGQCFWRRRARLRFLTSYLGHDMPGMRVSWGWRCRRLVPGMRIRCWFLRRHIVTGMRVSRSWRCRHLVPGMRIRRWLLRRHIVAGMRVSRLGFRRHLMACMRIHLLGPCRRSQCGRREQDERAGHACSPAKGRTLTTRIIPACMW